MRDSLVFYRSFADAIRCLDEKSQLEALWNIIDYALDEKEPAVMDAAMAVYLMAKPQIDKNNSRYQNGTKGGKPQTKTEPNRNQTVTKPEPNVNDNVNDNVNVNDTDTANAVKEKGAKAPKKKKHRYGEYQHVLLTDDERDRLMDEFGDIRATKAITYLDEYIQMKGYKAKDHNLAIRKWVFDALDREERQKARSGTTQLDALLEEIRRDEINDR